MHVHALVYVQMPRPSYRYDSDSTDPPHSLEPRKIRPIRRYRPNKAAHGKNRRDQDFSGNKRLSKSLDDLEIVSMR